MQALCKCANLPHQLLDQILQPQPSAALRHQLVSCGLPPGLTAVLQQRYNASQQEAVAAAAEGSGKFTLIQVTVKPTESRGCGCFSCSQNGLPAHHTGPMRFGCSFLRPKCKSYPQSSQSVASTTRDSTCKHNQRVPSAAVFHSVPHMHGPRQAQGTCSWSHPSCSHGQ